MFEESEKFEDQWITRTHKFWFGIDQKLALIDGRKWADNGKLNVYFGGIFLNTI